MRARAGSIRLLIAAIAVLLCARVPEARAQAGPDYRPGEVLVKYRASASPSVVATLAEELGSDVIESFPKLGIERVRVRDLSVEDAVARLRSDAAVEFAEPNYIYRTSVIPNDPGFPQLWGLLNTGQTGGTPGADIHAAQAWNTFTGSSAVLVGVIDTGVDYTHPDLAANMFVNLGEVPANGLDDDQNGFVDDVRGWDFVNNDNDPMDDHFHGTHVSGTIGAVGDNGIGVAGVTWSARILPIKFLDAGGSGSTDGAIRAIDYATLMGVRVINASWGGGGFSEALRLAIEAAGNAGVLFVAAAGNSGMNTDISPNYPSSYELDNIVAVAATDANDQLAYFSNYGPLSVDLAAPGVDTYSTILAHQYGTASGTSMATPHVVGVAALIRGRFPAANVAMTKALLLNRAEPRPGLAGRVLTGARLDALRSIADPDTIPPAAVTDLVAFAPGGSRMSLHWTASGDDGGDGTAFSYDVRYSKAPITEQNFAAATPATGEPVPAPAGSSQQMIVNGLEFSTSYHFALRVLDDFGNASAVGNDATATTLGPPDIAVAPDSLSADLLTGATATRTLTVTNDGVSDLVFGIRVEGEAGLAVDVIDGATALPAAVLARGQVVPLSALAASRPVAPTLRVGDVGAPDRLGVLRPGFIAPVDQVLAAGEEVFGSTQNSFVAGPRTRGNIFACTTSRILREHRFYLAPGAATQLWFLVYEGTSAAGDYSLVSASNVSPAGPGQGWYSSGDIDLTMVEGRYYLIVASFEQVSTYYNQIDINPYPIPASFGSLIGGAGWFWAPVDAFPPAPTQNVPPDALGGGVAYHQTLVTDDLVTWVAAAPESANVGAGSQLAIEVTFDASGMNDGDYDGRLVFESNDPDEPAVPIAVHLHVTGAPDIAVAPDSLDFGPLFLGGTRIDSVVVSNPGTALLAISSVSASPATFTVDPAPFDLAPGEQRRLAVTFAPVLAEPALGTLTLTSNDPDRPVATVALSGLGLVAPDIAVATDLLSADLFTGEQATRTLTVENTGGSDLAFRVSTVGALEAASIRVGTVPPEPGPGATPSSRSHQAPEEYQFAVAPHEPATGAPVLLIQDYLPWGSPANNEVLAANGIAYDAIPSSQLASTNLSAYRVVLVAGDQPTFTYQTLAGRAAQIENFVLQGGSLEFHAAGWGWNGGNVSLVTLPGGMRTVQYFSSLNHVLLPAHPIVAGVPNPFTGSAASHGHFTAIPPGAEHIVRDEAGQPNLVVYRHGAGRVIAAGQTLEFGYVAGEHAGVVLANLIPWVVGGGGVPWLGAEPLEGTIPAGESRQITVTFDATDLLGGDYHAAVRIESNDPDESLVDVPALLRVTGVPRIAVRGRLHDVASAADFVVGGAVTQHTLALPSVPGLDGSIRLATDGDFSAPGETATLIVEGTTLGMAGQRGSDCTADSTDFALTDSQLAEWGADRRVQVTVVNSPTVDPFCVINRHTVHFRYRDPGDQLAFGLRLIGTCRSETLEVSNPGTDTLVVAAAASGSPAFVLDTSELRLGPGASARVGVTFCPAAAGAAAGVLTFSSNDPVNGIVSVAMTGGGAVPPDIAVTPLALDVEIAPNDSLVRTLTISNTGGPLLWSTAVAEPRPAIVVASTPVYASLPGDLVAKDAAPTAEVSTASRSYTSVSASPPTGVAVDPLPGGAGQSSALVDVLASLDAHSGDILAAIPNRFEFFEGVTGTGIDDGGNDMYDGGNYLGTNLGGAIEYSDGVIRSHPLLGTNGRYFTRKYPGLFVFVADLDGVTAFNIDGNLGADGGGSVDGAVIDAAVGDGYRAFVKRVFSAGDPSVNHMVIVPDGAQATHSFPLNTNDDHHSVNGLGGTRIYYLLYAGANGGYIDNATTTNLLTTFIRAGNLSGGILTVRPETGGVPDGGTVTVEVTFHSRELDGGDYDGEVIVSSNDPDEDPVVIPTRMRVLGIPDIAVLPDAIDFGSLFVGDSRTRTLIVRNAGTSLLTVSGVVAQPGPFATPPAGFALAPRTQDTLVVSFAPTAVGPLAGTLTLSSDDPDESPLVVPLSGVGLVPPDIAVSPDSLHAEVEIDGQTTRTLTIENTGGSDLTFAISILGENPAARIPVPAALLAAGAGGGIAALPRSDQAPADYSPRTPSYATTAGARVLLIQDYLPWGSPANTQILAANGIAYDAITSSQLASTDLSAYQVVLVAGDQPTFTYQTLVGRAAQIENFVLQGGSLEFHAAGWGWNGGEASLVTLPGGMRTVLYGSSFNHVLLPAHPIVAGVPNPFTGSAASHAHFIAIPAGAELIVRDESGQPNLVVYRHGAGRVIAAGQTLEFGYSTGQHAGIVLTNLIPWVVTGASWLSAEPSEGTVPAGGSRQITVTFDATNRLGGDYLRSIRIASNDPDEDSVTVAAHMRVIGVPDIAVTPGAIDFGPAFVGATRTESVVVENTGTGVLSVSAVTATPGMFAPDSAAFVLAPGSARSLLVRFTPAAPGPISGTLVLASDDPDEPLANVALSGVGLVPPDIEVSPTSLSADLPAGGQATRTLVVSNTGGSDLTFQLFIAPAIPPDSLLAAPPDALGARGGRFGRSDHAPPDYRPASARASTAGGALVLLIQDVLPWGSEANTFVLDLNGIAYDAIPSSQLASTNLAAYRVVIVAGDQPASTYLTLAARAAQLEQFVLQGGGLEFHAAGQGFAGGDPTVVTLPGGMHIVNSFSGVNHLLLPGHPIVAGVPNPFTGSLASHAAFTSIPAGALHIARDEHGHTNLVSYGHGLGRVVAAGQALERGFSLGESAGLVLRNLIPYVAHGGVDWLSVQPLEGTVSPGGSALLTVTFDATGLASGQHHAIIEVSSDDPDESAVQVPVVLSIVGASAVSVEAAGARFDLAPVRPTPARGTALIEFELTRPGDARAAIFDVAGRRIRMLAQGRHVAGRHRIVWSGEGDDGVRRGAGVYLLQLETEEGRRTRRMVWVP
jgi:subtilisin family serine protease